MKSVGEAMSLLGRNFIEALGKVMRLLENKRAASGPTDCDATLDELLADSDGHRRRIYDIEQAPARGTGEQVAEASVTPGSRDQIATLVSALNWSTRCAGRRCCAGPSTAACPTARSPRCDLNRAGEAGVWRWWHERIAGIIH